MFGPSIPDDPASFARRRNREVSQIVGQSGKWSAVWKKRVLAWNAHLQRDRNKHSWAARILHYHGKDWLQEQRRMNSIGQWWSILAGRTGTRAQAGIVHKRWHDGVDLAAEA